MLNRIVNLLLKLIRYTGVGGLAALLLCSVASLLVGIIMSHRDLVISSLIWTSAFTAWLAIVGFVSIRRYVLAPENDANWFLLIGTVFGGIASMLATPLLMAIGAGDLIATLSGLLTYLIPCSYWLLQKAGLDWIADGLSFPDFGDD